ncbi:MAG TPA: hypothetical protein VD993_02650 [Chitinophagaceae bacterium]|nr:hypothetical protein [Chitinophagaceae bacterium]
MKSLMIIIPSLLLPCACISQKTEQFKPYTQRERALVQSVAFSPDGQRMYCTLFHRLMRRKLGDTSKTHPQVAIYEAARTATGWSDPVVVPFSGVYEDYEPTVSPDGKYIFYNSKRPLSAGGEPFSRNNIWYVEKQGEGWSEPKYFHAANTVKYGEDYPAITQGNKVYFMKETPSAVNDTISTWKIYVVQFPGSGATPMPAFTGNTTPAQLEQGDPWVAPDESYLIFTQFDNLRGWDKSCDLFICFRKNNKWSLPVLLEELNTANAPDYAVAISPDEQWIYYRANHHLMKRPFKPVLRKYKKRAVFS